MCNYQEKKMFHSCAILVVFFFVQITFVSAIVTGRQYASMPAVFHLDDFDNCMLFGDEALYCSITFEMHPLHPDNSSAVWDVIKEVSSNPMNYRHDKLRHGVCVPVTCPSVVWTSPHDTQISRQLTECYNQKHQYMGLRGAVTDVHCESTQSPYSIDNIDIFVAVFFICYIGLIIFASFYEGIARYQTKKQYEEITGTKYGRFLQAFSIPNNWYRLKSVNTKNPDVQKLRCIQGVRFYNMMCVIMAHTIMLSMVASISNPLYSERVTERPLNMFLVNGNYAVQTFFLISGWLLTYYFFLNFEGKEDVRIKHLMLIFVKRYARLTPLLLAIIALHSTWLVHLSRGPVWDLVVGEEHRRCRKNWWTNLIYLNNYIDPSNMCLQQSWYLAADTQLFAFNIMIVALMKKYPERIKYILSGTIISGMLLLAIMSYVNDYDILIRVLPEGLYKDSQLKVRLWHVMYSGGYTHISGYGIGLMYGYLFYKYRNVKLFTNKFLVALWWFLSLTLPISVIMAAAWIYTDSFTYTRLGAALYWAFGRTLFALGIGLVLFGASQRIGWFARWIIEWESVQVFGRLTYSAYLIHVGIMKVSYGIIRDPIFLSDYILFTSTLTGICTAYMAALVCALLIELPISALQHVIFQKRTA